MAREGEVSYRSQAVGPVKALHPPASLTGKQNQRPGRKRAEALGSFHKSSSGCYECAARVEGARLWTEHGTSISPFKRDKQARLWGKGRFGAVARLLGMVSCSPWAPWGERRDQWVSCEPEASPLGRDALGFTPLTGPSEPRECPSVSPDPRCWQVGAATCRDYSSVYSS
jgi:hypothetical protein